MATKSNTVTTSVIVQFTKGDKGSLLVAEVDDRETVDGGLNGDKTSFLPGDPVFILRYKTTDVIIDAEQTSLGTLAAAGTATIEKTEDVTFAGEEEASLRYPVASGFSYEWIGQSNGNVSLVGESTVRIPKPPVGSYAVGVARVTYNAVASIFRLTHSALELSDYSIAVFFAGHAE